jgi:hypothetical protein
VNKNTPIRNRKYDRLLVLLFVLLFAACCPSRPNKAVPNSNQDYGPGTYTLIGTMHFLNIESGCWQFTSESGKDYELAGNTDELRHDGVRAKLVVRDVAGKASTCMVGKIVEVVKVISVSH